MNYIETGDRVVVLDHIRESEHARSSYPEAAGEAGEVVSNNGWGLCHVQLDNGTMIVAWNEVDLRREDASA